MRRAAALTARLLSQFRHDPRLVVFIVVVPVFVMFILSTIFGAPKYEPWVLVDGLPDAYATDLADSGVRVQRMPEADALEAIRAGQADAFVTMDKVKRLHVTLEGSDPAKSARVLIGVRQALVTVTVEEARRAAAGSFANGIRPVVSPAAPVIDRLFGVSDARTFDYYGPLFIGYLTFFLVFLTSGISFFTERSGGTLDRLMASPLRRWEIVAGYVLGFGLLAFVQSFIVAAAGVYWLKLPMLGDFADLLAVTVLLGLMALATGLLVSEFANTELQVIQMLQAVVVPQIFLSGFFDLSTAPAWMQTLSSLLPLTYAARALRGIMLRGQTLAGVAPDVLVLVAFLVALLVADVATLRKYRSV